ncbi:tetratricopeptide repeat protein [Dolichospermum planctonicum CS-1226]|uniref:Tetratricopeptide repeat protein n=1 Tax=Dolichospermum planctonicum CS-1226 TaxID=3021751 RepID=A0ABT5ACB1_9CYAN|nr:tetratricopeptide repeat protein [Dolichospermum planctonicum]MDB9534910.1 tetratricopeptide repeat protein [Dolichospermum planctonicum CS-1226]
MAQQPPELTNADLEFLFNELLEGVHQARGERWALKYLQRMEPRITVDRWLDWLLTYGDKLLSSPAPNHELAQRMVQLGELGIGEVGNLSHDIGIQLLWRNMNQDQERGQEPQDLDIPMPTQPTQEELGSPGQELLRQGEELWEDQDVDTITDQSVSQLIEDLLTNSSPGTTSKSLSKNTAKEKTKTVSGSHGDDYTIHKPPENVEEVFTDPLALHKESLIAIQPQLASTLDELMVRLEQSTNLVEQLASDLAICDDHIDRLRSEIFVPNQAETLFSQGLQQAKSGNLLAALALYQCASQVQPQVYEYWWHQGLVLFHLQRFTEAIAAYDQTLALKPDLYKVWYSRGCILCELGEFDPAIAAFDQAISIQPDYQEAWSSRGLALLKLGLISEAITSYGQAIKLQPEDADAWYYRGIALAVIQQDVEAIASYDQALNLRPDYHEVWIDRGIVLFNLKRYAEAIASYDQALSIQPEFYLAWYNRGVSFENLGNRQEAIASYQKAIAIKPDFHPAWYNQAVALFYLERFAQAISCYDNALQIKMDYWEAWLGRGVAAANLNSYQSSLIVVSNISKSNPALNLGGYEGKLASYQEGLKHIRPDTHPEGWARLHIAIANTYYEQGKKDLALRDYWHDAISEYQLALSTLSLEDFPELYLEILQSLIKVFVCLEETATAQELQKWGIELLQQLLSHPSRSDESKKQLALKFADFEQLAFDLSHKYIDKT